jgi:FdrA protein
LGPDCGTALIGGIGLGFANQVRRGAVGLVAASGTGLQQVSSRIHQLGGGISHALGTGGRDLSEAVGAVTARQGLALLSRDPDTQVIVLISKPPSSQVADLLLSEARSVGKPVVVDFIGHATAVRRVDNLSFAATLDEAADIAVGLVRQKPPLPGSKELDATAMRRRFAEGQQYLRGLFSGGTLALEALLLLRDSLPAVHSNVPLDERFRLADSLISEEHTLVDLGEDELTVGRLHPMIDNDLRLRRLEQEAADPGVAVIVLDVVLGHGAHPDPAGELGPAIARARAVAAEAGRYLEVVAVVVGTDEDPQDMEVQIRKLKEAGARVETSNEAAMRYVGTVLRGLATPSGTECREQKEVSLAALQQPLAAINVGLVSFAESLRAQGAPVIQVDWRPPAGGNPRLMAILERMKG